MTKRDLRIVVSFFDGMSCGQQALKNLGVNYREYHSFEIEPDPIKVCKRNHPNTIFHGDVNNWREADINWEEVDLILAGSPCQGFSFAGKQLAFDDPRSALFFVWYEFTCFMRMVRGNNVIMLLENVKMKKEHLNVITEHMRCQPVFINSELVSAQSRPRWYWSNRPITQPKDRGVMLVDILRDDQNEQLIMSEAWHKWFEKNKDFQLSKQYSSISLDKAVCLVTRMYASWAGNFVELRKKSDRIAGFTENERGYRFYQGDKAKSGVSELGRVLKRTAKYSDAITTSHSPKLALNEDPNNLFYRKLSVGELCLLQGLPYDYCEGVSTRQAEIMLGNGWQVDTIMHIFEDILS